jgi:hypothetical protein
VEIATIITNRRTASFLDYRGGSLTLRRRDDESEAFFYLRTGIAGNLLRLARSSRQEGRVNSELDYLGLLAAMVRGDSPYH